jgi:hypothetical protein
MILLACRLRPPEELGPDRIIRLASEAGFAGLALDASVTLSLLPRLAADSLRAGLPPGASLCPLADRPLARGKRLPYLSAQPSDERLSAVKQAVRTLEAGMALGVKTFALELGPVPLQAQEADLRLAFARRQMDRGDVGAEVLRLALEERRARAPQLLDACRATLEPLLALAERGAVELALPVAATPWQLPSPREAQQLLDEFSGAPLGIALHPARWAVLESLQLPHSAERWSQLSRAARLLWVSDRVGLETELTLGLGELEPAVGTPQPAACIVTGGADSTIREVRRALRRVEGLAAEATAAAR